MVFVSIFIGDIFFVVLDFSVIYVPIDFLVIFVYFAFVLVIDIFRFLIYFFILICLFLDIVKVVVFNFAVFYIIVIYYLPSNNSYPYMNMYIVCLNIHNCNHKINIYLSNHILTGKLIHYKFLDIKEHFKIFLYCTIFLTKKKVF